MTRFKPNAGSVVDYLKSEGQDSSFASRKKLAGDNGIKNYTGSASQNTDLLSKMKSVSYSSTPNTASSQNSNSPSAPSQEDLLAGSQENATYGVSPNLDNMLASKFTDPARNIDPDAMDKMGLDTGIYADIDNIQSQVIETLKVISLEDNDIFSRRDISGAEKVALSRERKKTGNNKITQLRKLQNFKKKELNDFAEGETKKAQAEAALVKQNLEYTKLLQGERKITLDENKFSFDLLQAGQDADFKAAELNLDISKHELDQSKFIAGSDASGNLISGDFSNLGVGGKYGDWEVSQTYGTGSVLAMDNVPLVNGQTGTPGIDFAGKAGDPITAYAGGKIYKVTTGQKNVSVADINAGKAKASYGNQVIIQDESGNLHFYNHLQDVSAYTEGQAVQAGQQIGTMGNTGSSTNVHLDYRVKSSQGWEDPRDYLSREADDKYDFSNMYDYLNSTDVKVNKNITPETAQKLLIYDMQNFDLPVTGDGDNTKIPILNDWVKLGKISKEQASEYTQIRVAKQIFQNMDDTALAERIGEQDFENMNEKQRLTFLVQLGIAGKLNTNKGELFDLGVGFWNLDSATSGDIDEYYEDFPGSIILAQKIADAKIEEYNLN